MDRSRLVPEVEKDASHRVAGQSRQRLFNSNDFTTLKILGMVSCFYYDEVDDDDDYNDNNDNDNDNNIDNNIDNDDASFKALSSK